MLPLPAFERRAALWILLGFLALITLPYLLAPLLLPAGLTWGGLLGSADDQSVHLMWARQARDGHFFFRDLYTTESLLSGEKPLFFNVLPALMGFLSRLTGLEVAFPYHALRIALAAWALWQFHHLAASVTAGEERFSRARIAALSLLAFTTGAAFLAGVPGFSRFLFIDSPTGNFPLMPEAFFLLSAFAYPLNIASFGLLCLIFRLVLENKSAPAAFIGALLLSNIHTYDALPLLVTLALWLAWQRKVAKAALAAILGALIPVIYQVVVFRGSAEFRLKALTITAPPDVFSMGFAFAPLLILAAFGAKKWRDLPAMRLLLVWIVATFALVYAPTTLFSFARKMIEGVQIPLVLLAGIGLGEILARFSNAPARKLVFGATIGVLAISPALFYGWITQNTLENNASRLRVLMPPLALSGGDAGALRAIDAQPEAGAVLCLPVLGAYVPRATGKFTYVGHWAETLNRDAKFAQLTRFYRGQMTPAEARDFLAKNRIRWVIEGQFERALSGETSMAKMLGLTPIYQGGGAPEGVTRVYSTAKPS